MNRLVSIITFVFLCWPTLVSAADEKAADCSEVRELRIAGDYARAADVAEGCLEENPGDIQTQLEMARIRYAQDRPEDARRRVAKVLEQKPNNAEALVLRARLLARKDQYEVALEQLEMLENDQRQTDEVRRLTADLHLWQGAHGEAADQYEAYLDGNPDDGEAWTNLGHAQRRKGRPEAARTSYSLACEQGIDRACEARSDLRRDRAVHYFARIEPGYSVVRDRPDGQRLNLTLGAEPNRETTIEAGYQLVRRGFVGGNRLDDMGALLRANWAAETGPRVGAGAGWTFGPDFSPQWNAYLQGGWSTEIGLDAGLRVWRLQFPAGGTTVFIPSATYYTGPWMFDGRYYLALDDQGELDHTVTGRVAYYFGDYTNIHVGAGVGSRPDYIELSPLSEVPTLGQYTALIGGTLEMGAHHRTNLDLQYRREGGFGATSPSTQSPYEALEIVLSYTLEVW
jgi:YaiO family outer membrane protein